MKQDMSQKGFAPILIVLIFSAIFIFAGAGYWYSAQIKKNAQEETVISEKPIPVVTEELVPTETPKQSKAESGKIEVVSGVITPSDKSGWSVYKNVLWGHDVKLEYPSSWKIKEFSRSELIQIDIGGDGYNIALNNNENIGLGCPMMEQGDAKYECNSQMSLSVNNQLVQATELRDSETYYAIAFDVNYISFRMVGREKPIVETKTMLEKIINTIEVK
jgi:hypothetical protein